MYEFVEPHVRRLLAEQLGVGVEELVSEVSLRDDLAADSLDLVELALALEGEFAIVVPERILDQVRTFGDLVRATGLLIHARCEAEARGAEPAQRIWARIVPPAAGESTGTLERTGWLTPYIAETIGADAVQAGPGARLEITIAAKTAEGFVRAQRRFAALGKRGVLVTIQRYDALAMPLLHSTADHAVEPQPVAVARAHLALTDPLLDQLTGARTTVTVTGYAGDDPWQADDLIARGGQGAKRFGDGTPVEQAQALTGNGPCQLVEGDLMGFRATTEGHHVHAHFDRRSGRVLGPTRDFIEDEPTHFEVGLAFSRNARYYQSSLCTAVGSNGDILTSREAAYYSQDHDERAFDIGSSATRLTPTGYPPDRQQGVRAHFEMSTPSPNRFRPLSAILDYTAAGGAWAWQETSSKAGNTKRRCGTRPAVSRPGPGIDDGAATDYRGCSTPCG
jgi:acyl carrier protein